MIEYIYNTIRATAGEDNFITARITEEDGTPVATDCSLRLFRDGQELAQINGAYSEGLWSFKIPKELALEGKLLYAFYRKEKSLDFQNSIYFK